MKNRLYNLLFACLLLTACGANQKANKTDTGLLATIDNTIKLGDAQYKLMRDSLETGKFPKTYFPTTGKYEFSGSGWWCSGFYPGSLLYLYQQTKDDALKLEAERAMGILAKEQYNKTTHDLGFMMFCSFGNALKIAPNAAFEDILINSAKSLASRYNPTVGCIKSWDGKKNEYLVIIDNMMNLELLFWATKKTGDSSYYKIAVSHANKTMKNHFRSDFSSYHVINYNSVDGSIIEKKTAQGYSNESAWARGQGWGLYGYTAMYRETKDKKYLDQAVHIAEFILNHTNLPADKIPYWDFNAPNIPNGLRDVSAGALMASALLELSKYTDKVLSKKYFTTAETMIRSLSAAPYIATQGTNGGYLLQHSVGHMPNKTEIDVPLTYADYYFIEAMKRYKEYKK